MLINKLQRDFPETKVNGCRQVPVLIVTVPTPVTPTDLPSSVLDALGLPVQGKLSLRKMESRMLSQLKLAGTRVLVFDEASHLVERGAHVPTRGAADWFKAQADALNLTLLMFGVPRLERLLEHNEQLCMRASAARWLMPYDSRIPEHMQAFHSCVLAFAQLFCQSGFPIELPAAALTYQCYLLSGGLVGVLSRFLQELARLLKHQPPRALQLADCQAALNVIQSAGSAQFPAFASLEAVQMDVAPAALHQAYLAVMHKNDIAVRVLQTREAAV